MRIWDLDGPELIRRPLRLPYRVLGLSFSPDGSQLAIAGRGGVEVRDVAGGERLARLAADDEVGSAAFSPDGRLLAGGRLGGDVLIWEADAWRQVGQLPAVDRGETLGLAFSPAGGTLATSHSDGIVVLWDVGSQQPIGSPLPLEAPSDSWVTARFTPDGDLLFAVSDVGKAISFDPDPESWVQARVRRRRRPDARAMGGGRARAGVPTGLPLGLTSSAALLRISRVDPESTAVSEPPGSQPPPSLVSLETRSEATTTRRPE